MSTTGTLARSSGTCLIINNALKKITTHQNDFNKGPSANTAYVRMITLFYVSSWQLMENGGRL